MRSHEVMALFSFCYWHQPVYILNWITSGTVSLCDSSKTAIAETCFTTVRYLLMCLERLLANSSWSGANRYRKKSLHSLARNSHAAGASPRGTDNWGIPLVIHETTGQLRAKIMVWWSHCDHNLDFCFVYAWKRTHGWEKNLWERRNYFRIK